MQKIHLTAFATILILLWTVAASADGLSPSQMQSFS